MAMEWRNGVLEGTGWQVRVSQYGIYWRWSVIAPYCNHSDMGLLSEAAARTAALDYVRSHSLASMAQAERVLAELGAMGGGADGK